MVVLISMALLWLRTILTIRVLELEIKVKDLKVKDPMMRVDLKMALERTNPRGDQKMMLTAGTSSANTAIRRILAIPLSILI